MVSSDYFRAHPLGRNKKKRGDGRAGKAFFEEEKSRGSFGYKLLSGMGWEPGQGLGKENQGRTKYIAVRQRFEKQGLGTKDHQSKAMFQATMSMYDDILASVQRRVKRAQTKADGGEASDDTDGESDGDSADEGVGFTMDGIRQLHWAKGLYRRFHPAKKKQLNFEEEVALANMKGKAHRDENKKGPTTEDGRIKFTEDTQERIALELKAIAEQRSRKGGLGFGAPKIRTPRKKNFGGKPSSRILGSRLAMRISGDVYAGPTKPKDEVVTKGLRISASAPTSAGTDSNAAMLEREKLRRQKRKEKKKARAAKRKRTAAEAEEGDEDSTRKKKRKKRKQKEEEEVEPEPVAKKRKKKKKRKREDAVDEETADQPKRKKRKKKKSSPPAAEEYIVIVTRKKKDKRKKKKRRKCKEKAPEPVVIVVTKKKKKSKKKRKAVEDSESSPSASSSPPPTKDIEVKVVITTPQSDTKRRKKKKKKKKSA